MSDVYNGSTTEYGDGQAEITGDETSQLTPKRSPGVWDERITETERIYRALKRAILANTYRPGEALQEVRIAAEFQSSRTPVREAFQKLNADGLLNVVPRRGAFVQHPTLRDFLDINELRLILEPVAARQAAIKLGTPAVEELQSRLQLIADQNPSESDISALERLDVDMHFAIVESLPNVRMTGIIKSLNEMMQIVREQDMRLRHAELHASIGHILEALGDQDGDLAESLMRQHISDFSGSLRSLV
jgi:DNA-binding GntR family transcriptional regulator